MKYKLLWAIVIFAALGCVPLRELSALMPKAATKVEPKIAYAVTPTPLPDQKPVTAYGNALEACLPEGAVFISASGDALYSEEWRTLPITITLSNGIMIEMTQDQDESGLVLKNHYSAPDREPKDESFGGLQDGLLPVGTFTGTSQGIIVIYKPFYMFVCGPTIWVNTEHAEEQLISPGRVPDNHSA